MLTVYLLYGLLLIAMIIFLIAIICRTPWLIYNYYRTHPNNKDMVIIVIIIVVIAFLFVADEYKWKGIVVMIFGVSLITNILFLK